MLISPSPLSCYSDLITWQATCQPPPPSPRLSWYDEAKSWQTLIGSFAGFLALVAGALLNFSLNRRRDAMLRQEDVLSVATALYGEIMLLRKEAAQLSRAVAAVHINVGTQRNPIRRFDSHFLEENQLSEPMLYKALAARVGILPPRLVLGIAEFHQNFQEARTWLPLLLEKEDRKYTFGATSVLIPARDAIRNVVPTLRAIEAMANISELAPEQLDTGHADTIIELETEDDNIPVPEE